MKPKPLDLNLMKIKETALQKLVEQQKLKDHKEELRKWIKKELLIINYIQDFTIKELLHNIKSACEFYLKFRNDPSVFFALYPQYYDDFEEKCGSLSDNLEDTECFNEWLFKLAFKKVIENARTNRINY